MSIAKKETKRRSVNFYTLPPRVIINEILEYFVLWLPLEECKPYSLFGYFKKDRLRNIWFVFTALYMRSSYWQGGNECQEVVDIGRITFLRIQSICSIFDFRFDGESKSYFSCIQFMRKLINGKKNRMKSLEFLDPTKETPSIFQGENYGVAFPNLEKLVYLFGPNLTKNGEYFENWESLDWKKVSRFRSLEISYDKNSTNSSLGGCQSLGFLSNNLNLSNFLTTLVLKHVRFPEETKMMKFPRLEKLILLGCKNILIDITPGDCLRDFKFSKSTVNTMDLILSCQPKNLKSFSVNFLHCFDSLKCIQLVENYLIHSAKSLQILEIETAEFYSNLGVDLIQRIRRMVRESSTTLKVLRINGINIEKEFFEKSKLNFLHSFQYRIGLVGTSVCSFSENLKVLVLEWIEDLRDDFFEKNSWGNLQKIELFSCHKVLGENWGEMKRLKSLKICFCFGIDPGFFGIGRNCDKNMPFLEELNLGNLGVFEGSPSPRLENLKSLTIENCHSVEENLFQTFNFSKLEELRLVGLQNIRGEKWEIEKMENLRYFFLRDCPMNNNKMVLERILKERGVIVQTEESDI